MSQQLTKTQALIKSLYDKGEIDHLQKVAPKAWRVYKSKGMNDMQATKQVLEDGIKYEDLCAGWLNEGLG